VTEPDPYEAYRRDLIDNLDGAMNLACWLLRNKSEAEDAVQSAYVKALQAYDSYRGGNVRAWFLKIVRNNCITHIQVAARQRKNIHDFKELTGVSSGYFDCTQMKNIEIGYDLNKAILALSPKYKEVIILREIEGLTYAQIADIIGVPSGTVMSRLARARAELRRALTCKIEEVKNGV